MKALIHNLAILAKQIVDLALTIVGFLLAFRFFLDLFTVPRNTHAIIEWLYTVSDKLLKPFTAISLDLTLGGELYFNFTILIAILAYSVLNMIIVAFIKSLRDATRSN